MNWNIAEARQRFSEIIRQSAEAPQLIYNRNRLVAAVVAAEGYRTFQEWSEQASRRTIAEEFAELRQLMRESDDIARRSGEVRGRFAAQGIVRHQADLLIAGTAQTHQLTLVTRNTRDFENCGIGLLNPWCRGSARCPPPSPRTASRPTGALP